MGHPEDPARRAGAGGKGQFTKASQVSQDPQKVNRERKLPHGIRQSSSAMFLVRISPPEEPLSINCCRSPRKLVLLRQPHHPPGWVTLEIPGVLGVKIPYYTSVEESRCQEGENNNQVSIIVRFNHTCAADAHRSAFQVDWDSKQLLQLEGMLSGQIQRVFFLFFFICCCCCLSPLPFFPFPSFSDTQHSMCYVLFPQVYFMWYYM